jgi:hypothetical protein
VTEDLQLTGDRDPFTPWTPSALWTKAGLSVISPVFGDKPRLDYNLCVKLMNCFVVYLNVTEFKEIDHRKHSHSIDYQPLWALHCLPNSKRLVIILSCDS